MRQPAIPAATLLLQFRTWMEEQMPTGLLLMLNAPQRFKATYCNGEIYVAEVEPNAVSEIARAEPTPKPFSRHPAAS